MDAVLQRHDKEGKVIPAKVGIHCTNKQYLILAFTVDAVLQRHDQMPFPIFTEMTNGMTRIKKQIK
jgi:hypothetical protein